MTVSIGLVQPKTPANIGGVLRACDCYGAHMLCIQGDRYKKIGTDVTAAWRHIPVLTAEDLKLCIPFGAVPVAIELIEGAQDLRSYEHPANAFYIFGPEDGTLGKNTLSWCRDVVYIPTRHCMNLAATVNVVLYDRLTKTN